jgi:NADH-quinone oxidoreductase subunit G
MCLVKVNNLPKLMPACNVIIAPNMVIETQAEEVQRARRQVMQFIMLNHPVDCGICDKAGECTLQDYQQEYGAPQAISIDPKIHRRKLHELSPRISLDNERCILCSRCVRFTQGDLRFRRARHRRPRQPLVRRPHRRAAVRRSVLRQRDRHLSHRRAALKRLSLQEPRVVPGASAPVCTGCARGCSVQVWRRQKHREPRAPGMGQPNVAYRVTAFDNPQINGPWLCNKGFDLHKTMAQPRVLAAQRGRRPGAGRAGD